jgi:hypothetical protein
MEGQANINQPQPANNTPPAEPVAQKESALLHWQAPEFNVHSRNWIYYLITAIAFLAVVAYSIYFRDWFIIVIAVVLAGFFYWYPTLKPRIANYKISQLGFYVNDRIYQYSEIHSFWILVNQKENKLNIIFNKKYLPQLSILLDKIDPLTAKTILGKYIPEQENRTESLVDKLMRLLKL